MKKPLPRCLLCSLLAAGALWGETRAALPVGVKGPDSEPAGKDLYEIFQNPASNYRPFVRWWWNGGKVTDAEILRELDLLKEAGIGGVEINTIAFPSEADSLGIRSLPWLSDEWLDRVQTAVEGCRSRDMTADIIVGSGWPYGAEFLTRDQQLQMMTLETFDLKGGETFSMSRQEILDRVRPEIHSPYDNSLKELVYLRLMPKRVSEFTPGVSYDALAGDERIEIEVPPGEEQVLYCFVKLTGYMGVILGAPGAKGPVLNHFDRTAVEQFLGRMSERFGSRFRQMGGGNLRAAFTDSFELEGANWDRRMLAEFRKRRGYDLTPYLPYLIFKVGGMGNPVKEKYGSEFAPELQDGLIGRVRNDFDLTQRELFHEAFVEPYNRWCHRNGLLSRVQAYGRGLHPLESSMYIDIPECETWLGIRGLDEFPESGNHDYTISNKFVSSASLLSGNGRVSCEEITNTGNVFNASLEIMKITGDLSNLSGVNHSIFHGFNYSPAEAPFPGWIRYGAFLNERNTLWPHLRLWTDYKARLSAVFQNAEQQADIALMLPLEDLWSKFGAQRDPFPTLAYPPYAFAIWSALHQHGYGCDYVSENILRQARMKEGRMRYGTRSYGTLLMVEVTSIRPEAAEALRSFVRAGGRVLCIGQAPSRSVGLRGAEANDRRVQQIVADLRTNYPERFRVLPPLAEGDRVFDLAGRLERDFGLRPFVHIDRPDPFFSQNYYRAGERDIFFLSNYSPSRRQQLHLDFGPASVAGKRAWVWEPETGARYRLGDASQGLDIDLAPAASRLIVFEPGDTPGEPYREAPRGREAVYKTAGRLWHATFRHGVDGSVREYDFDSLVDLNTLPLPELSRFAGVIDYTTTLDVDDPARVAWLDAGLTHYGITEVLVNGRSLGVRWYGDRVFPLGDALRKGPNEITVRVTTTLGNYCKSLADNPTARNWTRHQPYYPLGLAGPVVLY